MSGRKLIRLNGFKQSTVSHAAVGAWRHPDNQSHRYRELDYWIETARTLEEGLFDGLFVADVLGVLDTHGGSIAGTLKQGVQTPSTDPLLAVSAMAAATKHLGFAITVSTTYEQPYALARKLTTLDHLTGGRIGWNIVTSALESAARNLGHETQVPHDERYAIADEFLEVVYKLWEGSWEDDAVVLDRAAGIFADPAKVHPIRHKGRYFSVPDAFLSEPSPQRTPVLFQAGVSGVGRDFAARHAEGIFIAVHRPDLARGIVEDVRQRAERFGHQRPEHLDAAGAARCLHHQQRLAAIVLGGHQKEARCAAEIVQFVGHLVSLESRVLGGDPASVRRNRDLLHGPQRCAFAGRGGATARFGLAGRERQRRTRHDSRQRDE